MNIFEKEHKIKNQFKEDFSMEITELTVHELQEKVKNNELTIQEITDA